MICKCTACHHEVQATEVPGACDWCGKPMARIAKDWLDTDDKDDSPCH